MSILGETNKSGKPSKKEKPEMNLNQWKFVLEKVILYSFFPIYHTGTNIITNTLDKNNTPTERQNNTPGYYRGQTTGNTFAQGLKATKRSTEAGCFLPVNTKSKKRE